VQTAEILAAAYDIPNILQVPALAPEIGSEELARWLNTQPDRATVAVVGHEPDLSQLTGWLVAATTGARVRLKKGSACLLECPVPMDAGSCEMQWLLGPSQLRMLRSA
jgi:phosphohistidine phosphatase